jgi:tRNA threonylcarbamoyladenosine biosynthesis protein TsaE
VVIAGQRRQLIIETTDPAATRALGQCLASVARAGDLVSLIGDLGAGKTQFAKGFGAGLGIVDTIVSPSFVLMAEYNGRLPLFHIDLYRLADAAEALAGGLVDERQVTGVTLIEWAERLADAMPANRLDVIIEGTGDDPRQITLLPGGVGYERYLGAASQPQGSKARTRTGVVAGRPARAGTRR